MPTTSSWSGSITATTAAHAAGAVSVVVTNTDAKTGTLTNGYTYTTTNPAPTVSAISPNTGTENGGTAVTVTGTGFQSGATVTIGGMTTIMKKAEGEYVERLGGCGTIAYPYGQADDRVAAAAARAGYTAACTLTGASTTADMAASMASRT